ncbi:MAG: hypothetical protein NT075_17080 [Chloroflexi bacterium]|nr:hypothetical protein [Chloroflexota bacterium]
MTEVAEATTLPLGSTAAGEKQVTNQLVFQGTRRNMVVGIAMLATAGLAFTMNLTHVFFASAMAWTFALWGGLLLYSNLLDYYETYTVTDAGLLIKNPLRPWGAVKVWDWAHLNRVDIVVKRTEANVEDAVMQVYYTPEGEIVIEREDRAYDPELVRLIIERAGLKPTDPSNPKDLTQLPPGKKMYAWNKAGRLAGG